MRKNIGREFKIQELCWRGAQIRKTKVGLNDNILVGKKYVGEKSPKQGGEERQAENKNLDLKLINGTIIVIRLSFVMVDLPVKEFSAGGHKNRTQSRQQEKRES